MDGPRIEMNGTEGSHNLTEGTLNFTTAADDNGVEVPWLGFELQDWDLGFECRKSQHDQVMRPFRVVCRPFRERNRGQPQLHHCRRRQRRGGTLLYFTLVTGP